MIVSVNGRPYTPPQRRWYGWEWAAGASVAAWFAMQFV